MSRRLAAMAATLLLVAGGGCTASGSKAGGIEPEVVLRLALVENTNAPYASAVRGFADRVGNLTDGQVRVELDFEAIGWTSASEGTIADMVRDGRTDLALVPPRAFDTVGIGGFEALQTPMLIDTPELAGAVATGDLAARLLDGLSDDGVVGLGLLYEGLRRPLATKGALTEVGQFRGLSIRVPPSGMSEELFRTLGATPDHADSHTIDSTGTPFALVETEFDLAITDFRHGSTVTANVVFFPKYDALLANPAVFERLSDSERQALRDAAGETAAASVRTSSDDEALAARFCAAGGHVALMSAGQLDAMRRAVAPVVDRLRSAADSGATVAAIESLARTLSLPGWDVPPACLPPTGDGAQLPSSPPPPEPPR
ncbi:TRAP transporter substrate-binding protein [Propionicimonas sp.]|uniref:TRAP transporter substrate-binding protein n=1 Tax=Propionicimonas sp. TaxID=1955623 RepID=UPI0039E217F8